VTIFNRGKREKFLPFPYQVEHLYGNRDPLLPADDERGPDKELLHPDAKPKGLEQLQGKTWDAVIDNSGYYPRTVSASAKLLAPNVKQYIFISSISVYADNATEGQDETGKIATTKDPTVEKITEETFGPLKYLSEKAAEEALPGRAAIVRPGYIVGPDDSSGRFTYWPVRIDRGGEALAPGAPSDPVQFIDVRDLGAWLIALVERSTTGVFNATGPASRLAWGNVLEACRKASRNPAKLTWVPGDWVAGQGQEVFPIWAPYLKDTRGFHTWKNARAIKAGLKFRPYQQTVSDTLAWYKTQGPEGRTRLAGPEPGKEAELLAKWRSESGR
jgi:2'-hydroxyisoflavone reductase